VTRDESAPLVVALILNWNNYSDTAICLSSLNGIDYPNLNLIVVDNGSTDGSGERLDSEFRDIDVLFNDDNRGFAGGMNPGIERALYNGADYIWLLNNDTHFPDTNVLDRLIETMTDNPDIGVVTPLIREYPDTESIWFWRGEIDWRTANADHANVPETIPEGLVETDYIPNCCSLFRTAVFENVGFLPERYFIYYEDVDHGVDIRDAGYRLVTDTATTVYHEQGGTSGDELRPLFSYYNARNLLLFARRFNDRLDSAFPLYIAVWIGKQIGFRALNGAVGGIASFIWGVFDGARGRTGRGPYP
jgi:GT2 family glycosyltransferase